MTIFNQVTLKDSANLDAFGRFRVSEPTTLFDSTHQYNINPYTWSSAQSANGGTVAKTANKSSATLTCATTASSIAVLQSKQYIRYQPGKSQMILMSMVIGTATANVRKRAGYFDTANGFYFEQNGTTDFAVCLRSSTSGSVDDSTYRVAKTAWNIDKLDGTGPSGITIDFTKTNILFIDLEWLGVGRVRWGFVIDGKIIYCHQHLNANNLSVQYSQTANLPVRFEVTNLASATGSMEQICCAIISEGGFDNERALRFSVSNSNTSINLTTAGTYYALVGLRPTATINSITNRGQILPMQIEALCTNGSTQYIEYQLRLNPTVAGTFNYSDFSTGNSIAQTAIGTNTNTVTGGTILECGYAVSGTRGDSSGVSGIIGRLMICQYDVSSLESVVLCASGFANGNTAVGSITWKEMW